MGDYGKQWAFYGKTSVFNIIIKQDKNKEDKLVANITANKIENNKIQQDIYVSMKLNSEDIYKIRRFVLGRNEDVRITHTPNGDPKSKDSARLNINWADNTKTSCFVNISRTKNGETTKISRKFSREELELIHAVLWNFLVNN